MLLPTIRSLVFTLSGLSFAWAEPPAFKFSPQKQVQSALEVITSISGDEVCDTPTGPIETTLCDFESVELAKSTLYGSLTELVETPFFKYFRTDLYRECPFWQENGFCMNRECGITTVDESQIPVALRAAALSQVSTPSEETIQSLPGCYYRDSDFCFQDDPAAEGDYIDLTENPERFTGYSGESAHRLWASIYDENCFGISEQSLSRPISQETLFSTAEDAVCEEKRVYYRIISGMHASISMHVCRDNLNQNTGEWGPDLACFVERLGLHPDRLQHIYFNTVLLLRAVSRLRPYLGAYHYCSTPEGVHEHEGGHLRTKNILDTVTDVAMRVGRFDESILFQGDHASQLKDEFKLHFRNVSQIMDCVGCDKCRLWGKVQITGLGTALKVLFELDEKALDPIANPDLLQRSEVVALINTLHRFTESLVYVDEFRGIWNGLSSDEREALMQTLDPDLDHKMAHQPGGSSSPTSTFDATWNGSFWTSISRVSDVCRRTTADGMRRCTQMVLNAVKSFAGMFRTSGKEHGPRLNREL